MGNVKTGFSVFGKISLSIIIFFSFTIILGIIFGIISMFFVETPTNPDVVKDWLTNNEIVNFLITILGNISIISAAIILYAIFERKKKWAFGWKQAYLLKELIIGLLVGIILISLSFLLILAFGGISISAYQFNTALGKPFFLSFLIFIGVAISEEFYSRGYVQGLIKYHFGTKASIIFSSILFALLHAFNDAVFSTIFPLLNLFLAGILLGISREVSGGLWMPIGFHLTWNFFQGNIFGFEVSGKDVDSIMVIEQQGSSYISGGAFGAEGSAIVTVVLIVASYVIYKYYTRRIIPNNEFEM